MKIIPNQMCAGIGEQSIEQRIEPWLLDAEQWFYRSIAPEEILQKEEKIRELADTVIHCRALWAAAPALDVTMHPNGLAVVNTDSLAPASADRSREFRKSIMTFMMDSMTTLLRILAPIKKWRQSRPANDYWLATTVFDPKQICIIAGLDYSWDSIEKALPVIKSAEERDARRVWSPELLAELRAYNWKPAMENMIFTRLRSIVRHVAEMIVASSSKDNKLSSYYQANLFRLNTESVRYKAEFVNICKEYPDHCRAWHDSNTAQLYNPITFKNEKNSTAYFF